MTKAFKQTVDDVAGLGYYPARLREDLERIQADQRLSADYKAELARRARVQRTQEAKDDARATWRRAQTRAQRAKEDLEAARAAVDDGINWQKLSVLSQEYAARLKTPPPGRTRQQVLDDLVSQAGASREGRRALNLAAGEFLSSGDLAQQATTARAALRQWAEEDAAPVKLAELEAAHADAGLDEVRRAILATEEDVTGQRRHVWSISEWQKDIFSEDAVTLGRVVIPDGDAAYFARPLPAQPSPSGIEQDLS